MPRESASDNPLMRRSDRSVVPSSAVVLVLLVARPLEDLESSLDGARPTTDDPDVAPHDNPRQREPREQCRKRAHRALSRGSGRVIGGRRRACAISRASRRSWARSSRRRVVTSAPKSSSDAIMHTENAPSIDMLSP